MAGSTDIILKGDHRMSDSEGEDFQKFPIFQPIKSHDTCIGCRARSPDIILEEDPPRSMTSKLGPISMYGP